MQPNNELFIKKAFESGLNESQVRSALAERNQTQPQGFDIKNQGMVGQILSAIVDPFITTGKVIGAAGAEVVGRPLRALQGKDPFFDVDAQGKKTPVQNPFLTEAETQEIAQNPLGFLGGQVGRSANIASWGIAPGGAGAATTLGRIGQATARGAGIGAIRGATSGSERIVPEERLLAEDKVAATLGNTLTGAVTGGITGGVLQSGGEAFRWVGSRLALLKEKLANQILGQTRTQVRIDPEGHNQLSMKLIDKLDDGSIKPGDYQSIRVQADDLVKKGEETIRAEFARNGSDAASKTVNLDNLMGPVDRAISTAKSAGNSAKANALQGFKDEIQATWGKTLNASQALDLKRVLEDQLNETVFKQGALQSVGTKASARVAGQRLLSSSARDWLRYSVQNISDALDDQSVGIGLRKAMEAQLQRLGQAPIGRFGNQGLSLTNIPFKAASGILRNPNVASSIAAGATPQLPPVLQQILGRLAVPTAVESQMQ